MPKSTSSSNSNFSMANQVPSSLKRWFVFHCFADLLFVVPLVIFPRYFLSHLGWAEVDPVAARLTGAALVGIGLESFLGRHGIPQSYRGMLRLKVLWSVTANLGLILSIAQGAPTFTWVLLAIFVPFSCLWIWYLRCLSSVDV